MRGGKAEIKRVHILTESGMEIICTKCLEFWPATTEFFFRDNSKRNFYKLMYWCRDCFLTYRRKHMYKKDKRYGQKLL